MEFFECLKERGLLVFDGAIGTEIQNLALNEEQWGGRSGCNEALNLSAPDIIKKIHRSYLAAGADVIEANSFGANRIVLSEYGLGEETRAVARAAARIACDAVSDFGDPRRFVAGSLGPGTKLPSLGHAGFDELYESYLPGARGLIEGGVDLFLLETCQDPLQIKACLCAVRDAQNEAGVRLPVAVSITIETTGTMLVGTEIQAAVSILSALSVDVIGINCATGPDQMAPYVRELCMSFPGPVLVMPNAGLPQHVNGAPVYTLEPDAFAAEMRIFVEEFGVSLAGGCCGTGPSHIAALRNSLSGVEPRPRSVQSIPGVASLYRFQSLRQEPPPFFVGERANTNGSRQFRELLLAGDWDGMVEVGKGQAEAGAHAVDLSVSYAGREEATDLAVLVPRFAREVQLPLVIDSTIPHTIEEALKRYGGRAIINSINLEDGGSLARLVCGIARRYGAAVIALTIDEEGMARSAEKKLAIARRIFGIAVDETGLRPSDLIFDPLTFTLGSGDETLKTAGLETIKAIKLIKRELPGVFTLLGVSNISYGLSPRSRRVLNSVFLFEAAGAGLDMAIVNVSQIVPINSIDESDLAAARDLVANNGTGDPLLDFIRHFEEKDVVEIPEDDNIEESVPAEELVRKRVVDGSRAGIDLILNELMKSMRPNDIINRVLMPAMKHVGELFGSGKMQLPFVLHSAEVMKKAVDYLAPFMERAEPAAVKSIVLATVKGDVHDVGKNLVDIILSNNGFKVYNLGIRVNIEDIVGQARELGADAIGMSGLLVSSTRVMKENIEFIKKKGVDIPVLLGGAALTQDYVTEVCAPILNSPVIYCADAFAGLKAMNLLNEGRLAEYAAAEKVRYFQGKRTRREMTPEDAGELHPAPAIPGPPFMGGRVEDAIQTEVLFRHLNEKVLFRARWGFRPGSLSQDKYERLVEQDARPALRDMKNRLISENVLTPRVAYGYWPCVSEGETLRILDPSGSGADIGIFSFPRQKKPPYRSIADYFLPASAGQPDVIAFQAVTIGPGLDALAHELYERGEYRDYLFYHGLGVELAETLAAYWHGMICGELGIGGPSLSGGRRCTRYSFGYPPCPDLEDNRALLDILEADRIGISVIESGGMVPEQSTSAFIVHHPQARYFSIE